MYDYFLISSFFELLLIIRKKKILINLSFPNILENKHDSSLKEQLPDLEVTW